MLRQVTIAKNLSTFIFLTTRREKFGENEMELILVDKSGRALGLETPVKFLNFHEAEPGGLTQTLDGGWSISLRQF